MPAILTQNMRVVEGDEWHCSPKSPVASPSFEIKRYSEACQGIGHARTAPIFAVLCAATTALCRRVFCARLRRGYITKRRNKKGAERHALRL
jgi:hypothetical protein